MTFNFLLWIMLVSSVRLHVFYESEARLIDTNSETNDLTQNKAFEICQCDLTPDACDPLCCCDTLCQDQVEYWKNTLNLNCGGQITSSKKYCYPLTLMRKINIRRGIQTSSNRDSKTGCVEGSSNTITSSFLGKEVISNERKEVIQKELQNMARIDLAASASTNQDRKGTGYNILDPLLTSSGSKLKINLGQISINYSFDNFECIESSSTSTTPKLSYNLIFMGGVTLKCSSGIQSSNFSSRCNYNYWSNLTIFKSLIDLNQIRAIRGQSSPTINVEIPNSLSEQIKFENNECFMIKILYLDFFVYKFNEINKDPSYIIAKAVVRYDQGDKKLNNSNNPFEIVINYIKIDEVDQISKEPEVPGFIPRSIAAIFAPLFQNYS